MKSRAGHWTSRSCQFAWLCRGEGGGLRRIAGRWIGCPVQLLFDFDSLACESGVPKIEVADIVKLLNILVLLLENRRIIFLKDSLTRN